jgi:CRISPR-associated protein Cmr2
MGPSTHAFVSRVLATFSHTIVPWVVECEYHGRVIYAGGDDVLAIAPASEALDIAARLAQLYSTAWIVDRQPEERPWEWRKDDWKPSHRADPKERFAPLLPVEPGDSVIRWPGRSEQTTQGNDA